MLLGFHFILHPFLPLPPALYSDASGKPSPTLAAPAGGRRLNLASVVSVRRTHHIGKVSRRRFTMRSPSRKNAFITALLVLPAAPPPAAATRAADFKREVIYQIITDRFFDGSSANNTPPQSAGLYDSTHTNWRVYWGGDLAGIQQKMSYLAGLGVTSIWISPPVDNLNTNIPDGNGNPTASYHGYQGRDFKRRSEEHTSELQSRFGISYAAF